MNDRTSFEMRKGRFITGNVSLPQPYSLLLPYNTFYLIQLLGGEAFQVFLAQDRVIDLDVVVLLGNYSVGGVLINI